MIDVLKEYDYETDVYYTKYSGHAKKIIMSLKDDIDLVVSLGGDGTFNEVVTGNFKRPKSFFYHIFHLERLMIWGQFLVLEKSNYKFKNDLRRYSKRY